MSALELVADWPVDHVAAAVVGDTVATVGDATRSFRLASLTKPISAWAIMLAVEEGVVALDAPLRHVSSPADATLRHLLSHAAGFGFDGDEPITGVEQRRVYSNTGIELAADELAGAAGMSFDDYLGDGVLSALGMANTELRGSPAEGIWSTLDDIVRFVAEMRRPTLLARETVADMIRPQYPHLAGIVPGVGRFAPCPWGLGIELHGDKSPHWMGRANSAATFGHFGGSGTMMWVDPVADIATVALTDRPFDEWGDEAVRRWSAYSDAVIGELRGVD